MRHLFRMLAEIASTDLSMLINGETGCGKELGAHAVHEKGPRAKAPFVVVDCGSIPGPLAESLLFGHEKGAFTGANERRAGAFHEANKGTLFLDELGELPIDLQPKLLRALSEKQVKRVGSQHSSPSTCASSRQAARPASPDAAAFAATCFPHRAGARRDAAAARRREDSRRSARRVRAHRPRDRATSGCAGGHTLSRTRARHVRELVNVRASPRVAAGAGRSAVLRSSGQPPGARSTLDALRQAKRSAIPRSITLLGDLFAHHGKVSEMGVAPGWRDITSVVLRKLGLSKAVARKASRRLRASRRRHFLGRLPNDAARRRHRARRRRRGRDRCTAHTLEPP